MFDKLRQGLRGVVDKISQSALSEKDLEPILWDLQLQLISNDVAVEVAAKISNELQSRLLSSSFPRFGSKTEPIREAFRESIKSVLVADADKDIIDLILAKKSLGMPFVMMFVGINGTGKTTTIAKVTRRLLDKGFTVVLASGDTYRAGAIEQLEEHARRLRVRTIKHKYGSDAAAVGFDAVQHARAQGIDVVLIDTAGRMQTNRNLMDELQKIKRVVQPDFTVMILDSLIGNDAVDQAKTFNEHIGFDATILTKVDADAKGGSSLSAAFLTGKPILYVGVGQGYGDLQSFEASWFTERILGDS
ncbi:signal recognition particle-docking protein FtsY [Candidatus Bathyarchaeota archaeon]|nr:signal recognition particle-docking protein FtsY [Candidatus Bathyarchaeota archaeon]MDP6048361.1 signal recognition particle-docking protein FtsY [Candidatus Bathyarchaeota archaeon]MDP7207212.1 signal recognition particle-docking protein FtsY [Candidatus Bathyarchaeota archaeon]